MSLAIWGWQQSEGLLRFGLAFGLPVLAAGLWGTFAVPEDRPSGKAAVPVPGIVRLLLELALFAVAVWALSNAGYNLLAGTLGVVTVLHYAISYDRVWWLIRHF